MLDDVTRRSNFWRHVVEGEKGCWIWSGAKAGSYGNVRVHGRLVKAHRYAWELVKGPIPEGHELWRVCETRSCVNPSHMAVIRRKGHSMESRFWKWVNRGGIDDNECWEWIGGLCPDGYGRFRWRTTHVQAHRVAWELTHGVVLRNDQHVYHTCGNRACVRPGHLTMKFAGRRPWKSPRCPVCGKGRAGWHPRACKRRNPGLWFLMEET